MITIAVNAFTPDSHVTSLLDEIHELHKQDSELVYIEKVLNTEYKDKLKYMILCEDKSNNEINEAVSELEKNLEVSLSNCVYEYQTLLKIIRTMYVAVIMPEQILFYFFLAHKTRYHYKSLM